MFQFNLTLLPSNSLHTLAVPVEVVDPHLIGLSNASGPVTAHMQPTRYIILNMFLFILYEVIRWAAQPGMIAPQCNCATQKRQ